MHDNRLTTIAKNGKTESSGRPRKRSIAIAPKASASASTSTGTLNKIRDMILQEAGEEEESIRLSIRYERIIRRFSGRGGEEKRGENDSLAGEPSLLYVGKS